MISSLYHQVADAERFMRKQRIDVLNTEAPAMLEALRELVAEADARPLAQGEYGYPDTGGLLLARDVLARIDRAI